MLLINLAPQSLRNLVGAPKIEMLPWYRNLAMVLAVWSGVTYTITFFMKWSWITWTFMTLGSLFSSRVISMLVRSTCKRSIGAEATIRYKGTLGTSPLYCKQCAQDLIDCCICLAIPDHQKCSCRRDGIWSYPWWPTSQWHPFRVATQWSLGTTRSKRSSVSPLGINCRYKAPLWTVKFCQFCKISQPSLLEVCSTRSVFEFVFFLPSASSTLHSMSGLSF